MINPVTVRGVVIGEGAPKIIVPIVGKTAGEITQKAAEFPGMPIDIVEWRADFYEDIFDTAQVLEILAGLRVALGEMPLLFTFRTKGEGGEREITTEKYTALNLAVAGSGHADLIDVEIFSGDDTVRALVDAAHAAGVGVVASNHDFSATPTREEIVRRLCKMQQMGADLPKIAVMPTCTADVLTLLAATSEMHEQHADRPIITMSMAATGVTSRLAGEVFGSAATFGAVGQVSAPGQIPVGELAQVLAVLHRAL